MLDTLVKQKLEDCTDCVNLADHINETEIGQPHPLRETDFGLIVETEFGSVSETELDHGQFMFH